MANTAGPSYRKGNSARHGRGALTIIVSTVLCIIAGLVITARTPKAYQARATFFVQSSAPSLNLPAGLMAALPINRSSDPTSYALAILQSDSFARQLVQELGLLSNKAFNPKGNMRLDQAAGALLKSVSISDDKRGLIEVVAEGPTPDLAADIANAYVTRFQSRVHTSDNTKRIYTASKIAELQIQLNQLQRKLRDVSLQRGVVDLPEQTKADIAQLSTLQGELQAVNTQLEGVESDLTTTGVLSKLAELKAKKAALVSQQAGLEQSVQALSSRLQQLPEAALEMERLQREIALKSTLFQTVAEQHQLAQIGEHTEMGVYQTVDRAVPPRQQIRPRPRLNFALSVLAGIALGMAINLVSSGALRAMFAEESDSPVAD